MSSASSPNLRPAGPGFVATVAARRVSSFADLPGSPTFAENPFIPSGQPKVATPKRKGGKAAAAATATEIEPWSVKHIGVNCISSAVNDPTGRYPDVVVSKSLPVVPSAPVPHVTSRHFEGYLRSVSKQYPQFFYDHRISLLNFNPYLPDVTADPAAAAAYAESASRQRVGPLEHIVPPVFFRPEFDVGDGDTFQSVLDSVPEASSSVLLQEALSHYLDLVEARLVQQVSDRSTSFFSAMDILNEVHAEITAACAVIHGLRYRMAALDAILALKGLEVVRLRQQRANLLALYRVVKLVSEVNQAKATVRLLLSQYDYADALDLSTIAQHLLETELVGLRCFSSLGIEFGEMRSSIEKVMKIELSSGLMKFVTGPFEDEGGAQQQKDPAYAAVDPETFERQMLPLFVGLVRVGKLEEYFENYRESLTRKIKQLVRNRTGETVDVLTSSRSDGDSLATLPAVVSAAAAERSLVQQLRELSSDSFLAVMVSVYDVLLSVLQQLFRVNQQTEVVLRRLQEGEETSILFSKELVDRVVASAADLVLSTHELAHIRCAKLLEVRKDVNVNIPLREFGRLFQKTMEFVDATEALTQKKRTLGLHGVATSQAKGFLDRFHQDKVTIIESLIENETWTQADIPFEFQKLVDQVAAWCQVATPLADTQQQQHEDGEDGDADQDPDTNGPLSPTTPTVPAAGSGAGGQAAPQKFILLVGQRFYIVTCTLMLVKFLGDYITFVDLFPTYEPEVARRLVDIISAFNAKTCQMILGGGALTTAGLKNIKTRHLAYASQSLGLLRLLVPSMKEKLRQRTPQKQQQVFLGEFDRVLKDVMDHQKEIHVKLGAVIPSRLETSKVSFRNANWNEPASSVNTPTPFAKGLVADVNALYKVISRYLPKDTTKGIMEHVYQQVNQVLEVEIVSMEVESHEAKERLTLELQFLVNSLESVGGLGGLGDRLLQVVATVPITPSLIKRRESSIKLQPQVPDESQPQQKKKSWFS